MRRTTLAFALVAWLAAGRAFATPFEPVTIPADAAAVGHLDMDALRKTQTFTAVGAQKAIDAALDKVPADLRSLARSVSGTVRGISFWRGTEHGALYVETRDARALAQLVAKAPVTRGPTVDGIATFHAGKDKDNDHGFGAAVGETLVLADSAESLERSIHTLGGKGGNLAGSSKLPAVTRTGVFVFVALGPDALGAIQKEAQAKLLQLGVRSMVLDVSEAGGVLVANAHADMGTADALAKAKSILDGVRAFAQVSAPEPVRALLDGVTVSTSGLALDVVAKVPVAQLAKLIEQTK